MTTTNELPDDGAPASKPDAGRWKPGQSGNPKGRARKSAEARAVESLARASSVAALDTVLSIMQDGDGDRVRLAAALAVIERGLGRAGDTIGEPVEVPEGATLADRAQAIADAAMSGAVSVSQASALLSCLASVAKVREVEELEQRIAALEAQKP
jgi:Family of unknown function (DUF5681)